MVYLECNFFFIGYFLFDCKCNKGKNLYFLYIVINIWYSINILYIFFYITKMKESFSYFRLMWLLF